MVTIVGVRFKRAGKIYYFNPGQLKMAAGDGCIVETSRGVEFGEIVIAPKEVPEEEVVQPLKQVLRSATTEDYERLEANKRRAQEAFQIAQQKIEEHQLPMKLLEAEYTLDDSKLIFSFTADGRVDFRELVKDLAAIFRTRIELRQVGVRDEAKLLGGLGPCGRGLCCATFLGDFEPVSIKMAKDQNLSLNPSKISGICGRLMCCLKYECDSYQCHKQAFGKASPDLPDEFYYDVEGEEDYYDDLLLEDSIQEVDYQMMLETVEIEKNTKQEPPRKDSTKAHRPKKKRQSKAGKQGPKAAAPKEEGTPAAPQASPKATDEAAPKKKRRRPRRRKPRPKQENKGEQ
ncbi:MAG: stage 0 sporulation family protein [Firmicutes bacterium]|nr:stage 0 sporulation family protein [Bacillota bacterium]